MAEAVLLRDVVALAGRFPALAGVDLDLEQGEVVVITGANGAGKTSLLRTCAGLMAVTKGEARVLGCDLRKDRVSFRRHVGMLAHLPSLYEDLTARENVSFSVRAGGGSQSEVGPAMQRVGLVGRLASTPAGRLSAGQRRRVALAVLAARRLPLWLLDEPHAGLDAGARDLLEELVKEAAATGTSVLLASHELAVVEPLAGRVVEMAGGRVSADRRVEKKVPGRASAQIAPLSRGGAHVA